MASDAEVDLVVNATRALSTLQRDLDRLINQAEASADPVLIAAALNHTLSLRQVQDDLNQVIRTAQAGAPDIDIRADVDTDDADRRVGLFRILLRATGDEASKALGPIAGLAGGLAKAGAAAGTAVPLLAGVAVAVESILPAAALATSGLLTLQLASATLKIGMQGVKEAIATAFDPDAKPEDLAEAMKKLGPHAKSFVTELASMKKEFKAVQIDVQNRLFANLDTTLARTAKSVLPSLHGALDRTADSLNDMARGAGKAAQDLGDKGILGAALASSTKSLSELERIPGQAVTAFGQLAAAAGPAMEGLSKRVAGVADRIAEKLSKAFESGALEKAINVAISNIDQLGRVAENIFGGVGNIIKAVTVDGEGLFGTLEKVSKAFKDLTASKEFQSALKALSETMNVLVTNLLPIVEDAFKALLPVIEILAPPIQDLIEQLGPQIQDVIKELAPVLKKLAEAFAELGPFIKPILELGLELVKLVLPILGRLFENLGEVIKRLTPFVEQLAENLLTQLEPVLAKIPEILDQLLPKFLELADKLLPLLLEVMVELGPALGEVSLALADLLVELTPLLVKFLEFQIFLVDKMMPIIKPLAGVISGVLIGSLGLLTTFIREFVIPAIRTIVAILEGDFQGAMHNAAVFINNLRDNASKAFEALKTRGVQLISQLGAEILSRISGAKDAFLRVVGTLVNDAIARMAELPAGILRVMSGLGSLLFHIGSDIVQGLINGIISRIGGVVAAAQSLADAIPGTVKDLLNIGSPSRVMIDIGEDTMAGLLIGLRKSLPDLAKQVSAIGMTIQAPARASGQILQPNLARPRPVVNVYLGNRFINDFVDNRMTQADERSTRVLAQGVRR